MQTFSINNIKVYPFTSTDQLIDYAESVKGILVAVNAEKVIKANNSLVDIINANIGYCDGYGPVLMARRDGHYSAKRIPGCELWLEIIKKFRNTKRFFLIGSTSEIIVKTVYKLRHDFPGIDIVGWNCGYFGQEGEDALIERITITKPDIIFVAMGSPKQEMLMQRMKDIYPAIYQGLGGSFDLYVGNFRRAPKFLRTHGFEWLWRFIAQPRRILRLSSYIKFAFRFCCNDL
ncbi:MAG: WecB/TagA/CpsF family glycosyltransferase [Muribaculum sp.]|nr:WecB/TagA/CpsF family glycosyltransferase [Muribaculum sp.]